MRWGDGYYLYISHQIHPRTIYLHRQIRMYALPMLMEKFVRETWFLVEEDHGAEVGLLIRAVTVTSDGEFGECMLVDEMVWAWVDCGICGGVVACHFCCWWCGGRKS
jgi:hypothetical protein